MGGTAGSPGSCIPWLGNQRPWEGTTGRSSVAFRATPCLLGLAHTGRATSPAGTTEGCLLCMAPPCLQSQVPVTGLHAPGGSGLPTTLGLNSQGGRVCPSGRKEPAGPASLVPIMSSCLRPALAGPSSWSSGSSRVLDRVPQRISCSSLAGSIGPPCHSLGQAHRSPGLGRC